MKNRRSAPNLCREALPLKLPRCSLIRALLHMFFDRLNSPGAISHRGCPHHNFKFTISNFRADQYATPQ